MPSFRFNPRIGSGRVDEGNYGQAKFFRELHQAQGFAVTFRLGHPEITQELFLSIAPFLLGDDHHGAAIKEGRSPD